VSGIGATFVEEFCVGFKGCLVEASVDVLVDADMPLGLTCVAV
jgi:hypothetical protein